MRAPRRAVRHLSDLVAAQAARRQREDAGDRTRDPGGCCGVSAQAVHDDRGRRDRAVLPARLLQPARVGHRLRVPDRRGLLGARRLHRDERRGPLERANGRSGARGAAAGVQGRVPRRLGHRSPGRRARAPRSGGLLLGADRLDRELAGVGGARPHRARVRWLAHLRLRAARRWHLHEGSRRRRRPRRQDRGRHPGGRSAQSGGHRGQRRRQRRRLRGHGGRPLRDVCRHGGCGDAARNRLRPGGPVAVPARARRHLDPLLGDRDVLHAGERGPERDHQRALPQRLRRDRPLGCRIHPGHDGVRQRAASASGTCTAPR